MNIMVEIQREKVELALKKELFLIALEQSAKEVKAAANGKKS